MTMPLQASYDSLLAKKIRIENETRRLHRKIVVSEREIISHEKARIILTEIQKSTQKDTKEKIESLVTLAIRSVFTDRDFNFKLDFQRKNNRIYVYPIVEEYDQEYSPEDDLGGGIVDIISIAMRVVLWHMESPRTRNTIILDEPFRFTGQLAVKAGEMLKYLSEKLNFQVIMVSHNDDLIRMCDQVYKVTRRRSTSFSTLVKKMQRVIRRRNASNRSA
jgi:DNA repair exonuclease SbcCD ATPase subunit